MTAAASIAIADAMVTALNGTALSLTFTAARLYVPDFELRDMDALHVSVVPAELDEEPAGRATDAARYTIHVAIQQKVSDRDHGGLDAAAMDGLMHLVEEIDDLFRHKRLVAYPSAAWSKTENKPIFDAKHLKEHSLFTSLLAFTFTVTR